MNNNIEIISYIATSTATTTEAGGTITTTEGLYTMPFLLFYFVFIVAACSVASVYLFLHFKYSKKR